mmetsp:Transcript_30241/g.34627  ORF Transcript_30241/g.34627 Transcript_30241/m.34627 type:complete len:317 (-) Transcript_30241:24-974(-)
MSKSSNKLSTIHIGMFALSFIGEINAIRSQYKENNRKLIYLSTTMSQLELLMELYFGHLNETVEPLIYFFEAVKALIRLKEYTGLITKEKMSYYISKELYDAHLREEERKKAMLLLPRSKKSIPKPDKFPISNKLVKFALSAAGNEEALKKFNREGVDLTPSERKNLQDQEENDYKEEKRILLTTFYKFILKKLSMTKKLARSKKLKVVELMLILRPFIYMYSLLKYGEESYIPFFISLAIEVIGIVIGLQKVDECRTETEKTELSSRTKGLLKYFLKEPFYSKWTVNIVYLLLHKLINDSKIGYVLGILSYFKYY